MMFDWLKKKTENARATASIIPPPPQPARGFSRTKYDPNLIIHLKDDHQELLGIYKSIMQSLDQQNYKPHMQGLDKQIFDSVNDLLSEFGTALKSHLLKEHVELYIYLEQLLAKDRHAYDLMHSLRLEMDEISAGVMGFLNTYHATPISAQNVDIFRRDFKKIGQVLASRIKREEDSLYPLYANTF